MKVTQTAALKTPFGMAGTAQLQVVGGPICVVMIVIPA